MNEILHYFKILQKNNTTSLNILNNSNNIYNNDNDLILKYINYLKNNAYIALLPSFKDSIKKENDTISIKILEDMEWCPSINAFIIDKIKYLNSLSEKNKENILNLIKTNKDNFIEPTILGFLSQEQSHKYKTNINKIYLYINQGNNLNNLHQYIPYLFNAYIYLKNIFLKINNKIDDQLKLDIDNKLKSIFEIFSSQNTYTLGRYSRNNDNFSHIPFSIKLNITYNDNLYIIKPLDLIKISKENLYLPYDIETGNKFSPTKNMSINYESMMKIYGDTSYKNCIDSKNGIINIDKWNEHIDFIISNFNFDYEFILDTNNIHYLPIDINFEQIYKSYCLAINNILKGDIKIQQSLLYKMIYEDNIQYNEDLIEQKETINLSHLNFLGYLRMNKTDPDKQTGKYIYFGLNDNQKIFSRKSLYNFCDQKTEGKSNVIALNGPPGTGKTTVLQTVIATNVVNNVLKNKEASIVFGCSATNQAKENIIDGFKHHIIHKQKNFNFPLYNRWINYYDAEGNCIDIDYGFSLAQGYKIKLNDFMEYLIKDKDRIKMDYITKYNNFINKETIEDINLINDINKLFGIKTIKVFDFSFDNSLFGIKKQILNSLLYYYSLFDKNKKYINDFFNKPELMNPEKNKNINNGTFNNFILAICYFLHKNKINEIERIISNNDNNSKLLEIKDIITTIYDNIFKTAFFHLSMRINEGSFIEKIFHIKDSEKYFKQPSYYDIKELYQTFSLICPVFVCTMHSLSNKIKYFNNEEEQANLGFIDLLLIDEAGQISSEVGAVSFLFSKKALIVGDTDQIEPVYSSTKKIDTEIFSSIFNRKMDDNFVWNCHNSSIMKIAQNYTPWHQYPSLSKGLYLLEHNRCPIELIRFCDQLKYKNQLLYTITSYYCDENGPLYNIPKPSKMSYKEIRNKKIKNHNLVFPNQKPWGLITNNGNCEKNKRINYIEIDSILEWIDNNYTNIKNSHNINQEKADKKEDFNFNKYIAIITPFKAQSNAIIQKGKKYSFKNNEINLIKNKLFDDNKNDLSLIIGTVHSLQGAEIPIVLFSNVYGDKDDVNKPFIDKQTSIINVGVSRAKQSFYVFANRLFLEKHKNSSATGLLYRILKEYE